MTAKIIRVEFGRFSKIRCAEINLRFPQLHRVTSFEWDLAADQSTMIATERPTPPHYTLGKLDNWTVHANPTFTPIDAPNPDIDQGWIVVRYHPNVDHALGYLDGVSDYDGMDETHEDGAMPRLYCIEEKFFTIVHRPAIAKRPSPALIFICHIPNEIVGSEDWSRVIIADAQELTIDDLYHPDDD